MSQQNTKPWPQAIGQERALLGMALDDPRIVREVMGLVNAEDFAYRPHRVLWGFMSGEAAEGRLPGEPVVLDWLIRGGLERQERVGGLDYVMKLPQESITRILSPPLTLAGVIRDKSIRRQLIQHSQDLAAAAMADEEDTESLVSRATAELSTIASQGTQEAAGDVSIAVAVDEFLAHLEAAEEGLLTNQVVGLPWGIAELDELMTLRRSELVCLAGRPGMGKSQLMLQACESLARYAQANIPEGLVYIASLEMPRKALVARWCSMKTGIPWKCLLDGYRFVNGRKLGLSRQEHLDAETAAHELHSLPIKMSETPQRTIESVRRSVLRLSRDHDVVCAALDFLQLATVEDPKATQRDDLRIGHIAYGLRQLAQECDLVALAALQLNRKVEDTPSKRPRLSHIDGSGKVEQASHVVAYIYRDEYYNPDDTTTPGQAEIGILKNRNGSGGAGRVMLRYKTGSFFSQRTDSDEPQGFVNVSKGGGW